MKDKVKRIQKLPLKEILEDLNLKDLQSFVSQYARKDKHFEIAIKSHFLSRLNLGDKGQKYSRILGEIIKPRTIKNQKIGPSLNKTIAFVFNDFCSQMQDCLSTENYTEVFYITSASLEKISYLQNKYELKSKSIEAARLQLLKGVDILLKQDLAPSFRKEMENYFKEMVLRSYYIPGKINLISILDDNKVLVREEKQDIIDNLLAKKTEPPHSSHVLQTMVQLTYPFEDLANYLISKYDQVKIYECLKGLIAERKFEPSHFIYDNEKVDYNYNNHLLKTLEYIARDNHLQVTAELLKIEADSIPPIELRHIIESLSTNYLRNEFKKIVSWVDTLPFGMRSSLYAKAQNYKGLIKILEQKNEFEWLKVYDQKLVEQGYLKELEELYYNNLHGYLENHIGAKSRLYLEKVSQRLNAIGQGKILDRILKSLSIQFEHRKTIKSILN